MSFSKRDNAFNAIMAFIIGGLVVFLFYKLDGENWQEGISASIGEVQYKYQVVLRKFGNRFAWQRIEPLEPVYAYDSILTRDGSDAEVWLKNGLKLELDANSMIELNFAEEDDELDIVLKNGMVKARIEKGEGASIRTSGGSQLKLLEGEARLSINGEGLNVSLDRGKVTLDHNGTSHSFSKGHLIQIDNQGKLNRQKIQVSLQQPEDGVVFTTANASRYVNFTWNSEHQGEYQLLISRQPSFRNSIPVTLRKNQYRRRLTRGTWYWQVLQKSKRDSWQKSAVRAFRVMPLPHIRVYFPPPESTVIVKKSNSGVAFRWQRAGSESGVNFRLSKENGSSASNIHQSKYTIKSITLPGLTPGVYNWQVVPDYPGLAEQLFKQYPVHRFNLQYGENESVLLAEGDDRFKARDFFISLSRPRVISPVGRVVTHYPHQQSLRLNWKPVPRATHYQLEVYTRDNARYLALLNTLVYQASHRLKLSESMLNRDLFMRVIPMRKQMAGQKVQSQFSETRFFLDNRPLPPEIKKVLVRPSWHSK